MSKSHIPNHTRISLALLAAVAAFGCASMTVGQLLAQDDQQIGATGYAERVKRMIDA